MAAYSFKQKNDFSIFQPKVFKKIFEVAVKPEKSALLKIEPLL